MILIADSGSTKTNWGLISSETTQYFQSKGMNPHFLDVPELKEIVKSTFLDIRGEEVNKIYFYGTGITDISKEKGLIKALQSVFPYAQIFCYSDIIGAARSIFGNSKGLIAILGTGANSGIYNGKDLVNQILPLGFWLGDEGSGAYLGKELIKRYLRGELPPELIANFENRYHKMDRLDVFKVLKESNSPNYYFAAFTPFLNDHIAVPEIEKIVETAFEEFYVHAISRYNLESIDKIGFVGSIAHHFHQVLRKVVSKNVDHEIMIEKDPLPRLMQFHLENELF